MDAKELQDKYGRRHGFVFSTQSECSKDSITKLTKCLIDYGVTTEEPETVLKSNNDYFFIYKENSTFPTGNFYTACMAFHLLDFVTTITTEKISIDTIKQFLKDAQ